MSAAVRLLIVTCCVVSLAACNRASKPKACAKPREYHAQRSIPPLDVPEDLDAPDPNSSVKIPDVEGGDGEVPQEGSCLENPPDFFDTSPV